MSHTRVDQLQAGVDYAEPRWMDRLGACVSLEAAVQVLAALQPGDVRIWAPWAPVRLVIVAMGENGLRLSLALIHMGDDGIDGDEHIDRNVSAILDHALRLGFILDNQGIDEVAEIVEWVHVPSGMDRSMFKKLDLPLVLGAMGRHAAAHDASIRQRTIDAERHQVVRSAHAALPIEIAMMCGDFVKLTDARRAIDARGAAPQ